MKKTEHLRYIQEENKLVLLCEKCLTYFRADYPISFNMFDKITTNLHPYDDQIYINKLEEMVFDLRNFIHAVHNLRFGNEVKEKILKDIEDLKKGIESCYW